MFLQEGSREGRKEQRKEGRKEKGGNKRKKKGKEKKKGWKEKRKGERKDKARNHCLLNWCCSSDQILCNKALHGAVSVCKAKINLQSKGPLLSCMFSMPPSFPHLNWAEELSHSKCPVSASGPDLFQLSIFQQDPALCICGVLGEWWRASTVEPDSLGSSGLSTSQMSGLGKLSNIYALFSSSKKWRKY